MPDIIQDLKETISCDVLDDEKTRNTYKHDASVFEIVPQAVVFPKKTEDIEELVHFVTLRKKKHPELSLTPRAAGTCMSGGSLTDSIMIDIKNFDKIEINTNFARVGPGAFYRDFEKELDKNNLMYPPYPSSKLICKIGGMVANNAGGEKSLGYGKTENFVEELEVVLTDGKKYTIKKLTKEELLKKCGQGDFEGELYVQLYHLLDKNSDLIKNSKPQVSKNSTGYNIWNVWDGEYFNLPQLFVGSQGTLGIITEVKFKILPKIKHRGMLIAYLDSFDNIPEIVKTVLTHNPNSFETYDDNTLRLALKYFYGFSKSLHKNKISLFKEFFPDFIYSIMKGMPKLTLIIEYENNDLHTIHENLEKLKNELTVFKNVKIKIAKNEEERKKYWAIRRESFNLLRLRVKGMYAPAFIDDTVVNIDVLSEFFPKIYKILNESGLIMTIAGHIGNGNFHIFPLMDLSQESHRKKIYELNQKVFDLVLSYKGSISGEHNDGLIRSPYIKDQFGSKIYNIFAEIKHIFDPEGIFNPHKKIGVTKEYAQKFLIDHKPI
jgi:FAD/FMN-containing dehydrogenase